MQLTANNRQPAASSQQPPPALIFDLRGHLSAYRKRVRRQRRLQYVSVALLVTAALWLAAALGGYFRLDLPWLLPIAIMATVALPILALLIEVIRKPSLMQTATMLDRRLDDRQRLVTSVELLSRQQSDALDGAQLHTTGHLLTRVSPRDAYPVRAPVALWSWSAGLLLLALGLVLLGGAGGGFTPIPLGTLPPDQPVASVFATNTPLSGLPESERTPDPNASPTPTSQPPEIALDNLQPQPGDPAAPQTTDESGNPIGPSDPQADSQEAQSGLDRLGEVLDTESATQPAGDSLRQGDPQSAAEQLRELGVENDQLSDEAKRSLAESLERAADETEGNRALRKAENEAAEALRDGDYREIKESLERLADALEQTAADVIPQDELAQSFPSPTATGAGANAEGAPGETNEADDGDNSGGEQGTGQGSEQEGGTQAGGEGSPQGEGESEQPGQGGAQSEGGDGQSQSGAPGQGTRVGGPTDNTDLDAPGNPFELEGQPDPNANRSGDEERPGLELDGGAGTSGGALPAQPGGTVDAPGENPGLPMDRWDIVRRYFEHGR